MIPLREQIEVARSPAEVFRYLADFSTGEQWDPGVYRAEKMTPGAPRVGTEFALVLNSAGRRVPMRYRLVDLQPNQLIHLQGEGQGIHANDIIRIGPGAQGGSRIDYTAELTFSGPARYVEPALRPWLNRVGRQAVSGLAQALSVQPVRDPGALSRLGHRLILPGAWQFTERGYLAMPDKGLSEFADNRNIVITGPTSGLGLAAACLLARLGARLLLVGRGHDRLNEAVRQIRDFSGCDADRLWCFEADLSQPDQVRDVAHRIMVAAPVLDGLINNAGALFAERDETPQGHERALAINLIAPWVLTEALLPALNVAPDARVVNVASGGMYMQPLRLDDIQYRQGKYDGAKAYARAKRALVAVNEHWAAKYPHIGFHAMHPGWASTPGVERALPSFNQRLAPWLRDARMGADTMVWLASSAAVNGRSGEFWFDRRPRPTALLPGTAVSSQQRDQLIDWLEQR